MDGGVSSWAVTTSEGLERCAFVRGEREREGCLRGDTLSLQVFFQGAQTPPVSQLLKEEEEGGSRWRFGEGPGPGLPTTLRASVLPF